MGKRENRIVMVLQGNKQETGKSTFIRFLSPWGVEKYYTESPTLQGGKDTEFKFAENYMYNLEELAALNTHDIEKLKAIISKRNIKERRAYAVYESEMARRCNFWGSTNQDFFLQDFENTRWLVFKVISIDWKYTTEIDIHKVWAEAWYLYQSGVEGELSADDRIKREIKNEGARIPTSEEELIALHYRPNGDGDFYTSSQIAGWLGNIYGLKLSAWRVGRAIKKVFNSERVIAKIDGKPIYGYYFSHTKDATRPDGSVVKVGGNLPELDEKPPKNIGPQLPYKDQQDPF